MCSIVPGLWWKLVNPSLFLRTITVLKEGFSPLISTFIFTVHRPHEKRWVFSFALRWAKLTPLTFAEQVPKRRHKRPTDDIKSISRLCRDHYIVQKFHTVWKKTSRNFVSLMLGIPIWRRFAFITSFDRNKIKWIVNSIKADNNKTNSLRWVLLLLLEFMRMES